MSFDQLVWVTALSALGLSALLFWFGRLWLHEYSEPAITRAGRIRKSVCGVLMGFCLFVVLGAFTDMKPAPKPDPVAGPAVWHTDYAKAVELAKQEKKPLFIDFGANWCNRCKEIERETFDKPEFLKALQAFVAVKIDESPGEDGDPSPAALATDQKFGVNSALPTLVLVTADEARIKKLDGKYVGEGDKTALIVSEMTAFAKGEETAEIKGGFAAALEKGIFWAILAAFLGGLAASLTPCVYPMIPVTVSIIGGSSQGSQAKAFGNSLIYVGGMALCYSVLGVSVAAAGGKFSAVFQNRWFLITIAAIFLMLGAHMLEIRKLGFLMWLNSNAGTVSNRTSGVLGIFLMGILAGFVFAPCVGPILLGVLTYIGQTRDMFLGFVFMFTFAIGMGLPFVLLGTFSGLVTRIRGTAGDWMIGVEAAFGAALVGAALYFLLPAIPALSKVFSLIAQLAS